MKHTKNFNKINNNKCCPECGSTHFDELHAETICKNCGLVVSTPFNYVGGVKINSYYAYDYTSNLMPKCSNFHKNSNTTSTFHKKPDSYIVRKY